MAYKLQDTLQLLYDAAIDCETCFACLWRHTISCSIPRGADSLGLRSKLAPSVLKQRPRPRASRFVIASVLRIVLRFYMPWHLRLSIAFSHSGFNKYSNLAFNCNLYNSLMWSPQISYLFPFRSLIDVGKVSIRDSISCFPYLTPRTVSRVS